MSDNPIPERVYIQYSVDFSEIPTRVRNLIRELANTYAGFQKVAAEIANKIEEDPVYQLSELRKLEEVSNKATIRIKESSEILSNYIDLIVAASKAKDPKADSPPQEDTPKAAKRVATIVKGI